MAEDTVRHFQRSVQNTFLGFFVMGFLPKWILLVLKRLLEFNNFSWGSFHQMVSKQLNSLIEVNQATMEVSQHRCLHTGVFRKCSTQIVGVSTQVVGMSTQCYWMEELAQSAGLFAHLVVCWNFQHKFSGRFDTFQTEGKYIN